MIPKAQILQAAKNFELQPTTVQKDYVLGWLLRAISGHPELSKWVFKGGTCLKKCYFETYRFSEDLYFTVPQEMKIDKNKIPFDGPLKLPPKSLQRIKLDITQDELIAGQPVERDLHHNYSDRLPEAPGLL